MNFELSDRNISMNPQSVNWWDTSLMLHFEN